MNLSGDVYGVLRPVRKLHLNANGNAVWRAECECGKTIDVVGSDMRRMTNPIRSCGCDRDVTLGLTDRVESRVPVRKRRSPRTSPGAADVAVGVPLTPDEAGLLEVMLLASLRRATDGKGYREIEIVGAILRKLQPALGDAGDAGAEPSG